MAGPYYSVNVDQYGRVIAGSLTPTSQWQDDGSGDLTYGGGSVTIGSGSSQQNLGVDGNIIISGPGGTTRNLYYATGALDRWSINAGSSAESGSNAGSNLLFSSFKDDGTPLETVFALNRASGNAIFYHNVTAPLFLGNLTATSWAISPAM